MIRLIVNADDLGSGPGRDRGIFAAFQRGIITSASLLANGPTFTAASREARRLALPVGVHLNLAEGRSLTGAIPGITDGRGEFMGKTASRQRFRTGDFSPDRVRREFSAQINRVLEAGVVPDHLDTHQHSFLFPALTGIVLQAAREAGIRALRLPLPAEPSAEDPSGLLGAEVASYRRLAPAAADRLREAGLFSPDGLWGMPWLGRLDEPSLAALLCRLPAGTWELMAHPGLRDPDHPFSGPERESELAALTSPAIRRLVRDRSLHLISFGDLFCVS
jgi:predicted glycoside hydrolase/deacetylase ChbG (UPF0249 family)